MLVAWLISAVIFVFPSWIYGSSGGQHSCPSLARHLNSLSKHTSQSSWIVKGLGTRSSVGIFRGSRASIAEQFSLLQAEAENHNEGGCTGGCVHGVKQASAWWQTRPWWLPHRSRARQESGARVAPRGKGASQRSVRQHNAGVGSRAGRQPSSTGYKAGRHVG
ncbi:hypothetical protein FKM82_025252 [Ascaphus truei]